MAVVVYRKCACSKGFSSGDCGRNERIQFDIFGINRDDILMVYGTISKDDINQQWP